MNEHTTDPAIIHRLLQSQKRIGFACMASPRRIGCRAFMTFLEYRYFPPGTDLNALYQLAIVKWLEMEFALVIIPRDRLPDAEKIMKELGLRMADGTPTSIEGRPGGIRMIRFPFDYKNVFTIENVKGHFAYKNDPTTNRTAEQMEDEACDREIDEYEATRRDARL